MKFLLFKGTVRGKDTEQKEAMVIERDGRREMGEVKDHLEQRKGRRNHRPGMREEKGAGEGEQGVITMTKGERGMRSFSPK